MSLNQSQFAKHLRNTTNVGLTTGLAVSMAVGGMTHEAPLGGYADSPERVATVSHPEPTNVPKWDKHLGRQFEGFRDMAEKPKSVVPSHVVAVHQDASHSTMPFEQAWSTNHDKNRANDVWPIGYK